MWRCNYRSWPNECLAKLVTNLTSPYNILPDRLRDQDQVHDHVKPSTEFHLARSARSEMNHRAGTTLEGTSEVMSNGLAGIPSSVNRQISPTANIQRSIQRNRQDASRQASARHGGEAAGLTMETITLPRLIYTNRQEDMLLRDTGAGPNRILIFGTRRLMEMARQNPDLGTDGTFKSAARGFYQMMTIHFFVPFYRGGKRLMKSIPFIYALLPNKQQDTYRRFFTIVKDLMPGFQPRSLISDFEQAIRSAFQQIFPTCTIAGCFFHLMQNLLKKV